MTVKQVVITFGKNYFSLFHAYWSPFLSHSSRSHGGRCLLQLIPGRQRSGWDFTNKQGIYFVSSPECFRTWLVKSQYRRRWLGAPSNLLQNKSFQFPPWWSSEQGSDSKHSAWYFTTYTYSVIISLHPHRNCSRPMF